MFKRLTLLNGNPFYVNPAHIVAALPCYRGEDEFTHVELWLSDGRQQRVLEILEEIEARELGDLSPKSPDPNWLAKD